MIHDLRPLSASSLWWSAAALLATGLLLCTCLSLDEIDEDTCGNGVLEPAEREECDTYAVGEGTYCIPAGQAWQCRFGCEPAKPAGAQDTDTEWQCPIGWGCGKDGVCRRANGTFGPVVDIAHRPGHTTLAGDVDGNGADDLVAIGASAVAAYFDVGSTTDHGFTLPLSQVDQPPHGMGDLNADGRADLLLAINDGLAVFRGGAEGALLPTIQLTSIEMSYEFSFYGADLHPDHDADELLFLSEDVILYSITPATNPDPQYLVMAEAHVSELAAPPAIGQWKEDTSTEEFVLAYLERSELFVYQSLPSDPRLLQFDKLPELSLAGGAKLTGGLLAAQINPTEDAHLDLVIGTDQGVHVAYGTGRGTFHSTSAVPAQDEDRTSSLWYSLAFPLALGDLDGDQVLDWVGNQGVWLSTLASPDDAAPTISHPKGEKGFWGEARVADFNGNGHPDLMTARTVGGSLDFYNGTSTAALNHMPLPTEHAAHNLRTGDFDGDLITDLAMVQVGGGDGGRDALAIAFGNAAGAPNPPVSIGAIETISAVRTLDIEQTGEQIVDTMTDLIVFGSSSTGTPGYALIYGRGDRQLQASLLLLFAASDSASLVHYTPVALSAARLVDDATAPRRDVAVVAHRSDAAPAAVVAALRSTEEASIQLVGAPAEVLLPSTHPPLMTTVDLDEQGLDEIVVLASSADEQAVEIFLAAVDAPTLSVTLVDGGPTLQLPNRALMDAVPKIDWHKDLHDELVSCQLSSEGPPALLAALYDRTTAALGVTVLPGELLLQLFEHTTPSEEPEQLVAPADERLAGFGCLNADVDPEDEVVLLTVGEGTPPAVGHLYIHHVDELGAALSAPQKVATFELPSTMALPTSAPLRGLLVADADGDGVEDIVVAARDTMLLLRGHAMVP